MAQTDLAVRIATIFDEAGIKKADKAVNKLQKSTSKLGKALGISLSAYAIASFGKAAVKAFAADEKSATMLTLAVKNLGLAFEQANVDKFISDLERSAAIADDELRPAFQALLTTTGSVIKSQELLKTAIEASRGSGIDLATVAQDLANAYVGNTKGLKKYNLGLSQAELKAMSFLEIQQRMNDQFKGASAAYLATYTGQMEALSVAAGSAAEVLGKSLIDAILNVSGAADASTLGTYIENVTGYLAGLIDSVAKFVYSIKWILNPKNWFKSGDQMWQEWDRIVQKRQMAAARLFDPKNNAVTGYKVDEAARNKAIRDAARRQKELLAAQNKQTAELKKQAALKKAGTVFDIEQIQIVAALKNKLSEQDKLRLEAQLALLNGNADLATKLTNEILKAQDASGNLAKFLAALPNAKNPFEYLDAYLSYLAGKAAAILTGSPAPSAPSGGNTTVPSVPSVPSTNVPAMPSDGMISYNQLTGLNYNPNANNVVVELKITGDGDITNTIAKNLMNQSLSSGNQAYINRRTGGFE